MIPCLCTYAHMYQDGQEKNNNREISARIFVGKRSRKHKNIVNVLTSFEGEKVQW